jgi:uridylate kinase
MHYKRILLKLSGETLVGNSSYGIASDSLNNLAAEIKPLFEQSVEIAIVIGAGNIWRGAGKSVERVTADYMGMLATIMNCLALRDVLEKNGIPCSVQSAIDVSKVAELYRHDRAKECLKNKEVVILAGGTGNPFFTTDTTAALRAAELQVDVLLKATQVDGVYDDDPKKNPQAKRYETVTFTEAIEKRLRIMDTTAFSLCRDNNMSIIVFDFHKKGNLFKVISGEKIGTLVVKQ